MNERQHAVTTPASTQHSALHNHPAPGEDYAQLARTCARSSLAGPREPVTRSIRSALEIARQRWGTEIGAGPGPEAPGSGEPGQDSSGEPGGGALAAFGHLNSWSRPSAPLRDVWADYTGGARQVIQASPLAVIPYWLTGIPGFAVHCLARLIQDASARNGRFAGLLAAVGLLVVGLALAGWI